MCRKKSQYSFHRFSQSQLLMCAPTSAAHNLQTAKVCPEAAQSQYKSRKGKKPKSAFFFSTALGWSAPELTLDSAHCLGMLTGKYHRVQRIILSSYLFMQIPSSTNV